MTGDETRHDYARIAYRVRAAVIEKFQRDTCILTVAVLCDLLAQQGITAHPLKVRALGVNDAFMKLLAREGRMPETQEDRDRWYKDRGAYSVGIGFGLIPGREETGWNGHLVATIPPAVADQDREWWLIDASLDQIDRPIHHIQSGIIVARVPSKTIFGADQKLHVRLKSGHVVYMPDCGDQTYEQTISWQDRNRRIRLVSRAQALGDSAARLIYGKRSV